MTERGFVAEAWWWRRLFVLEPVNDNEADCGRAG